MKLHEAILISLLMVISFAFGIITRVYNLNSFASVLIVLLLYFVVLVFSGFYTSLEALHLTTITKKVLFMGRGIPTSFIRSQLVLTEVTIIAVMVLSTYSLVSMRMGRVDPIVIVSLVGVAGLLVVSIYLVRIRINMTIAFRKTSVEVEFPFFLSFVWSMSESHLTLYDLFNMIERSASLKAWSKEIFFAKKLATTTNTSLVQALVTISETHPSPLVRDIFKRIVSVGYTTGSARNVVRKAFRYIYDQLQDRLMRLTEKLDIINGAIMFGFLFLPIILATISPISGQGALDILYITIVVETSVSLLTYAFISHVYPSGFAVATSRQLTALSITSVVFLMIFIFIYVHPALVVPQYGLIPKIVEPGMNELLLFILTTAALTPPFIYSEIWLKRARTYSTLMKLIIDAVEVSVSTGENFITVLDRMKMRENPNVQRMVTMIVEGYRVEEIRRAIVSRAPSLFYASFLETVLYSLLVGAHHRVLSTVVNSFESLGHVVERISSVSRTLELMIVSLSAMLGFFIKYLEKMFSGFAQLLVSSGKEMHIAQSILTVFQFNPSVFIVITGVTLATIIVVSFFTGKTRGGSLVYGFRTALASTVCHIVMRMIVSYL